MTETLDAKPAKREKAKKAGTAAGAEQLDLHFLLRALVRGLPVILIVTALAAAFAAWKLVNFPEKYRAEMVLQPRETAPTTSSLAQGLASSFLGGGSATANVEYARLEQTIASLNFSRELDERYNMIKEVYAKRWDAGAQTWRTTELGMIDSLIYQFQSLLQIEPRCRMTAPTVECLSEHLQSIAFEPVEKTPFMLVSYEHADPKFAGWFLTAVYDTASELIRIRDLAENETQKKYLYKQLAAARLDASRQALASLIQQQELKSTLLEPGLSSDVRVLIDVSVPQWPVQPNFLLLAVVPIGLALIGSAVLVLVVAVYRAETRFSRRGSDAQQDRQEA
ncbi:MAG: Wzz/FepE/Etk N-terminal domain-containing protein [Alphaproteobacteria bacterium]